jgi:hypothetical protein
MALSIVINSLHSRQCRFSPPAPAAGSAAGKAERIQQIDDSDGRNILIN